MVKDAYTFAIPPMVLGVLCLGFGWYWAAGMLMFLGLFVFYFFRNPERTIPSDPQLILSPADGHVVEIVEEAFEGTMGRRISVFLAVWDVHVQRAPVAGKIVGLVYRPGKFYAAMRGAASEKNEQNVIYMDTAKGRVVFKQIAGAIARRVICWKREGQLAALGELVGMIRFGSRVDIWLPMENAAGFARRGQKVKGGESVHGEMEFDDLDPIGHEESRRPFQKPPAAPRGSTSFLVFSRLPTCFAVTTRCSPRWKEPPRTWITPRARSGLPSCLIHSTDEWRVRWARPASSENSSIRWRMS